MTTATTTPVVCADCGKTIEPPANSCGTGYGVARDGAKVCYECCGKRDAEDMRQTGKATLYYFAGTRTPTNPDGLRVVCGATDNNDKTVSRVGNWPGTLMFRVKTWTHGKHNIARERLDLWFIGPDGKRWHGVRYGRDTDILHCRRLKAD